MKRDNLLSLLLLVNYYLSPPESLPGNPENQGNPALFLIPPPFNSLKNNEVRALSSL